VLRGHEGAVRTAVFDPAGECALTASADGTARTWNARSGALLNVLDPIAVGRSRVPLVGATFDPSGERIATTDESGTVIVWRGRDAVPLATLEGGKGLEIPARFSRDGKRLALTERPGCVLVVELESGRSRRLHAHQENLSCLRFTPDGERLMTGGDDRTVCLWDATIPPDAAQMSDCDVPLWRTEPFETPLYRLKLVFDVDLSRNGRWIVAACESGTLQLIDARDGRVLDKVVTATPGRIAFDHEQDLLMVSSKYSSTAALWRIAEAATGAKLVKTPVAHGAGLHHQNSMTSLAAAAHAHVAVTTSLDRAARLWNMESYDCLACYVGHEGAVLDGDVDARATMIVTASADGTARLWPCDLLETAKRFEPESLRQLVGPLLVPAERGAVGVPR
jgi:WD40 repeat protein